MSDDNPFSDPSLQAADSTRQQEELPSWATAPADGAPPTSWSPPEDNKNEEAWSAPPPNAQPDNSGGGVRGAVCPAGGGAEAPQAPPGAERPGPVNSREGPSEKCQNRKWPSNEFSETRQL